MHRAVCSALSQANTTKRIRRAILGCARHLIEKVKRRIVWHVAAGAEIPSNSPAEGLFDEYGAFVSEHRDAAYDLVGSWDAGSGQAYRWVGAQEHEGAAFCIPCGSDEFLAFDKDHGARRIPLSLDLEKRSQAWTGGCVFENRLYCFPRESNHVLFFDFADETIGCFDLDAPYRGEHHYGGALAQNGVVYQPPRNTDHILAIDLVSQASRRIQLAPKMLRAQLRYCGSVSHPNGLIYFLPERDERVLVFDPLTESFKHIGDPVDAMVFDACIDTEGTIYGFSAYEPGILRIDVAEETSKMICTDIGTSGCFGTKLGINGKMYGVPGDGPRFLEFDPRSQKVIALVDVPVTGTAKCAGGATMRDGLIACAPARRDQFYLLSPDEETRIPESLYRLFFLDSY